MTYHLQPDMMARQISNMFVDSKGHCFLCLEQVVPTAQLELEHDAKSHLLSLHRLSRYVKIDFSQVLKNKGLTDPRLLAKVGRSKLGVELCKECASITKKFSKLCQQLEKIEMEVNSHLSLISGKLLGAGEAGLSDNLGDIECELNFDDGDGVMGKLELLEGLRREAREKCSFKLRSSTPRVKLDKLVGQNKDTEVSSQKRRYSSSFTSASEIELGDHVKTERSSGLYDVEDSSDPFLEDTDLKDMEIASMKSEYYSNNKDLVDCGICHQKVSDLPTHLYATHYQSDGADEVPVMEESFEVITKASTIPPAPICTINPENGKHKCGICSKELRDKYIFQTHYKSAHLQVRYKCTHCEKEFSSQFHLTCHHRAVHLGMRNFNCPACNKQFTHKFALQQHQRGTKCGTDEDPKPFKCRECGKSFTKKGNLQVHMNAFHLQLTEYECKFCGKKFKQKGSAEAHMSAIHLREREHECEVCGKKFNQKGNNMQNHQRRKHPNIVIK